MYILGVNVGDHDSSAALLHNGQLVCMIEQERLSRRKRAPNELPLDAILACLEHANLTLDNVDIVAVGWDIPSMQGRLFDKEKFYKELFPSTRFSYHRLPDLYFVPHHMAHAASAFWSSGFDNATIVVIDGYGEMHSTTTAFGTVDGIQILDQWEITQSLGNLYAAATAWTGLHSQDAGKFMGLASYAQPRQPIPIEITTQGYRFPNAPLPRGVPRWQEVSQYHYLTDYFRQFNYPFCQGDTSEIMAYANFAASVQQAIEQAVLQVARVTCGQTRERRLVLAGGVAMNCTMNGMLMRSGEFQDIYLPPVPYDAGVSLGAALWVYQQLSREKHIPPRIEHAYWAPITSAQKIEQALQRSELSATHLSDSELISRVTDHLANGRLVGWFQGRAEVGQRALGARSILGDPRQRGLLPHINKIKGREVWRPLAPSILEEFAADILDSPLSPATAFMLVAYQVRREVQRQLPAIVHVDGSTRPQIVRREITPLYWNLLRAFYEKTGSPAIINTSFNLAGEPIVYSPEDAINTFYRSEIEVLVMDNFVVEK